MVIMKIDVVQGTFYVVTAKEASTITDDKGMRLAVKAGAQAPFYATGASVEVDGECTLQQVPRNFSMPLGGAGGQNLPMPELLPRSGAGVLQDGHLYIARSTPGDPLDMSSFEIEPNGLVMLGIDYYGGQVLLPGHVRWVPVDYVSGQRFFMTLGQRAA